MRPKRKHIPIAVKRAVAERQYGQCCCGCALRITLKPGSGIQFDHDPALRLRDVNEEETDYLPAQLDPFYIVARCRQSHKIKTSGTGATVAGSDIGKIVKERSRAKRQAAKPKRSVSWGQKRKTGSSGLRKRSQGKLGKWVSRKIQSRGFAKVKRPIRRRQFSPAGRF